MWSSEDFVGAGTCLKWSAKGLKSKLATLKVLACSYWRLIVGIFEVADWFCW